MRVLGPAHGWRHTCYVRRVPTRTTAPHFGRDPGVLACTGLSGQSATVSSRQLLSCAGTAVEEVAAEEPDASRRRLANKKVNIPLHSRGALHLPGVKQTRHPADLHNDACVVLPDLQNTQVLAHQSHSSLKQEMSRSWWCCWWLVG